MYEEALALLSEPAQIKRDLPLAYVVEKYGVHLTSDGQRLSGICPFHPDTNPSMDIFEWGSATRFSCFACGASGDVLDFIQRMGGKDFRSACEMAQRGILKMQAEGWKGPVLKGAWDWDENAAFRLLSGAESGPAIAALCMNKGWAFPASHLTATWGVRSVGDEVLVPIWNEHRELVAMKHRPSSGARSLISLPGSQLRSTLYGADGPNNPYVLLCEGESDVWTASWLLRDYLDCDVLGLPAGAGAAPCRLDLLADRTVVIALDGDDAGRQSAARWKDALGAGACILNLPDGEDITSVTTKEPNWLPSKLEEL